MEKKNNFTFEISLSILNHLGRNLYRSFATVLGEAISNAWDADAKNVYIHIDLKTHSFLIKDDGIGMSDDEFQSKFLKIGYSKRKNGEMKSDKGRPFIGRKGIGKLALLSCADKISVITKKVNTDYVGGVIDNSGLDQAITQDLTPQEYPLEKCDPALFESYIKDHTQGTIIYFHNIKDKIKNSIEFLKKTITLYFRFSLLDDSFCIYINDEPITIDCLNDLANKTEFLWQINNIDDPYLTKLENLKEQKQLDLSESMKGFIASVEKPRDLKIINVEERLSIDLFVNGRLREKDILKHISYNRLPESYIYGQIHFDDLDDETDRFTSSRESVVAEDPKYQSLLKTIKTQVLNKVIEDWDKFRIKYREDGDSENKRLSKKQRKSKELYNAVSGDYKQPKGANNKGKIDKWIDSLADDAQYNFTSYADCFISENLIRKFITDTQKTLSPEAIKAAKQYKEKEKQNKGKGNLSIEIRRVDKDINYLSMDELANLVDKAEDKFKNAALSRDAYEYKPTRDALMHTALLTQVAKLRLSAVYENIKGRINNLLS